MYNEARNLGNFHLTKHVCLGLVLSKGCSPQFCLKCEPNMCTAKDVSFEIKMGRKYLDYTLFFSNNPILPQLCTTAHPKMFITKSE